MFHTELRADVFLSQAKTRGTFQSRTRVACIDSEKCLSWFCKEIDDVEGKLCKRTGKSAAEVLPVLVDYKFPDNPQQRAEIKQADVTYKSFLQLIMDCTYRGKEKADVQSEKKTVEVAPRYCVVEHAPEGIKARLMCDVSRRRLLLVFYTSRELAQKSIAMAAASEVQMLGLTSVTPASVRCLGEDLSVADYFDALLRALKAPHNMPNFGQPEKPNFWDAIALPALIDANIKEKLTLKIDAASTLGELMEMFPKIWGTDYSKPEITHYKGYSIFIHHHYQDKDYAGVVCKGTFHSREEAVGQDSLRVFDFFGTKENVERRIKAWVDQQVVIDEKNQRKAERKAQREEQAEANKPFRWFVPHKLVGYPVSGAIENDGTIVKKSSEEPSDFVTISNTIGDLWDALGNRRWFVNGDIVKFIKHANVPDTRMDGLFFPYDAFYVIFENSPDPERRFMIRNHTIQYLRVVRVKSEQACKLIDDSMVTLFMPYKCVISIVTSTDNSKEVFEGAVFIDIADSSKIPEGVGSAEEKAQIQRIVVALLLLYSGRVEIFKKYTIPRSQRYELNKGIKDQHKDNNEVITMMPLKKLVVEDPKPSDGTGQKRKTHMRGWCLDTLRHPRYRRNPDGTLRTRIRPPCIINDPQKEV
jgi:hypothetical protein